MKETLVSQLKAMKEQHRSLVPSDSFKRATKERVLLHCQSKTEQSAHTSASIVDTIQTIIAMFIPTQVRRLAHTVGAVLLIVGVGVGGWIASVSASYQSIPGDMLYGVKLATERVQIAVTEIRGEKNKTAKLHTEFAARRAVEVQQVIERNKEPEQAKEAMQRLARSVDEAAAAIDESSDNTKYTGTDVLESTKQLLQDTSEIMTVLQHVSDTLPVGVVGLVDDIIVMQQSINEKRLTALGNVIAKRIDGHIDISESTADADIDVVLHVFIATLHERVDAISSSLEELPDITEVADQESVVSTTSEQIADVVPVSTTQSSAVSTTVTDTSAVSSSTVDTPISKGQIQSELRAVETILTEVETLFEQGDLIAAIEVAKKANAQVSEVEQRIKQLEKQIAESIVQEPVEGDDSHAQEEAVITSSSPSSSPILSNIPTTTPGDITTTTTPTTSTEHDGE
jgi:hypothetical protein